jgi:hypothetical protein
MNIAVSISHEPVSGLTCALLLGCSPLQAEFIHRQVREYAVLASHPLLLPTLFTGYQRRLLNFETSELWRKLLEVESKSGQTGAPAINSHLYVSQGVDYNTITIGVLEIIQLTSAWESYTQALLLGIESIQESIGYINAVTPHQRMLQLF